MEIMKSIKNVFRLLFPSYFYKKAKALKADPVIDEKEIKFESILKELEQSLAERSDCIGINEPLILKKAFAKQTYSEILSQRFLIGGPCIPMVMCLGGNSGRIYYFALKALINLDI